MNQRGFTIIESLLFLAISAGFVLIAVTLLQGRNRDVQFADATRGLEGIVEQVQGRVRNGVRDTSIDCVNASGAYTITSDGSVTSDGSCILLGEVMVFGDYDTSGSDRQQITVYPVFGQRLTRSELQTCMAGQDADYAIFCANPYIYDSKSVFNEAIPWSVELFGGTNGKMVSGSPVDSNILGFVRDPSSERIVPFSIERGVDYAEGDTKSHFDTSDATRTSAIGDEISDAYFCYEYSSTDIFYGALRIGQDNNANSVTTQFGHQPCIDNFGDQR